MGREVGYPDAHCMYDHGTYINPDSPLVAMPFSLSFHRGNYYARGADGRRRGLIRAEGRSVGWSDGVPREAMVGRSQVALTGSYIVKLWMGVCYPVGILRVPLKRSEGKRS